MGCSIHSQFLAEDFILKLFHLISYANLGPESDLHKVTWGKLVNGVMWSIACPFACY